MNSNNLWFSLPKAALFLALILFPASVALAVPNIKIGDYFANPGDLVNVTATVTGGDQIAGLIFITGTGPFLATPGNPDTTKVGPTISNLDIHWLFAGNDVGQFGSSFLGGRKAKATDTTIDGSVPASGTLATFTLNTIGVPVGVYELRVANMATGSGGIKSNFVLGDASILTPTADSGHLFLGTVPEPSTLVLGLFALAGLSAMVLRKQRLRRIAR